MQDPLNTNSNIKKLTAGLATGLGWADPALGPGAAALAPPPPPDLGSPLAFSNTAFSQCSLIWKVKETIKIQYIPKF